MIFGVSAIITTVDLGLFTMLVQAAVVATAAILGVVNYSIATLLLCWYLYVRAKNIAAYSNKTLLSWIIPLYIILMTVGLIAFGIVLLEAGYPSWIGIGTIVLSVVFFAGYLMYNDTIPQIYYLVTAIVGVVIFLQV